MRPVRSQPVGHSTTCAIRRALRHVAALIVVTAAALVGVTIDGATVSAHTDFSSSTPSDGDVLDDPVETVTLTFTGESEEAGDGFVVLDASGRTRRPTSVSTVDDKVFTLSFDPPLAGGEIGVRWSVRAPDKHPIDGSFSFTVSAPSSAIEPNAEIGPEADTSTDGIATTAPAREALDDFLAVDAGHAGETRSTIGRILSFAGVALAIGGVGFLGTTLRGQQTEVRWFVNAVRAAGALVAVGAVVEYSGVARMAGETVAASWSTGPGFAALLRLVAGVAVAVGLAASVTAVRWTGPERSLSSAVNTSPDVDATARVRGRRDLGADRALHRAGLGSRDVRWIADRSSTVAFVGCTLMVVSFWFDGHTVSKGWRPLHALANSVHIVAGSVWMGGVVAMSAVMWRRHRRGLPSRALELVVRFSSIAAAAVGAVVVAGLVMAVSVLDSFGQLTGSEWGQLLLLKSVAAGFAVLGGAYNHFQLLPALDADPDDPELRERLRSVVTAEAILLGFVVAVTAWLVAAAT